MVGRSSLQQNSLPTMENLPLQRGAENVHIFGRNRRLLPCCAQRRLERTPQKYYPSQTSNPWGHTTTTCSNPRPPRNRYACILCSRGHCLRARSLPWKLEKENFEKFDEAETIVHAAIVESLSQGTIRTINTQHIAGISSLTAFQLVEVIHNLYNTPTLQDITTVENDLKRPLAHFEDFLDHVTDHLNNHESLRSFNQPASNITKIQTFKESIRRWPQFDTLIATWEINNSNVVTRQFSDFTDYLCNQYGNLPTDVKPRGGNAYNVRQAGRGRGRPKGKGKGKGKGKDDRGKGKPDKGKGRGLGRFVYWDEQDIPANKRLRPDHQVSSAVHDLVDEAAEQEDDAVSIHSRTSARSSASAAHQVHGSHTSSPLTSSAQNPNPKLYFYCNYHGWNLTHAGPDCRVMLNDTSYDRSHLQAKSPNDTTPRGNDQIEPIATDGRKRPFLKAWRAYSH